MARGGRRPHNMVSAWARAASFGAAFALGLGFPFGAVERTWADEACCFPAATCQDIDPAACVTLGGHPLGEGSTCASSVCYENQVVADDFVFGQACPDCPPDCDYNNDNVCDNLDLDAVFNCVINETGNCDFTCDGVSDFLDYFVFQCTLNGDQNCCSFNVAPINYIRWYGSYLDPDFQPFEATRFIDGWLFSLHGDVAAVPCPPPPVDAYPVDLCGIVVEVPGCAEPGFLPDGSVYVFRLTGGPAPAPGTRHRVCGYIDSAFAPCGSTVACFSVQAYLACDSGISRPSEMIAQWVFPHSGVSEIEAGVTGCDGHPVFVYDTFMHQGCLVYNDGEPGEVEYYQVFPRPGRVYWLSIQPIIGRTIEQTFPGSGGPVCTDLPNGNAALRPFWGWHTTPPGYHQIDDAYVGSLGRDCSAGSVHTWREHLHWSDPNHLACADDPTKSADMAFYLSNYNKGGENVLWAQPLSPGAPVIPPPTYPQPPQLPRGGTDEFPETTATLQVNIANPPIGPLTLTLTGPTLVARKNPIIGDPLDTVATEIIAMTLSGQEPALGGDVRLTERVDQSSAGQISGPTGSPFPVDSFFDVFVRIELPGLGVTMVTDAPVSMLLDAPNSMWEVPPGSAVFQSANTVQLVDEQNPGVVYGQLISARHDTGAYLGGIDIHSDADIEFTPLQGCVCRGDIDGDGRVDAIDIQGFVDCYLGCTGPGCVATACPCNCADMNADLTLTPLDVDLFAAKLLFDPDTTCP